MGAWGPALFSDDLACDVRDGYRGLIEDGTADEDAQRHVLESYAEVLDDPDEGPVVWLALAVAQSKIGRLDATVRDRALGIIERGEGLSRWAEEGAKALTGRQAVLQKVQVQLTGPQPERKRLHRPWRHVTDLTPGTVLAYRVLSGKVVLLRVARIDDDRTGCAPVLSLMNHLRDGIPSRQELDGIPNAVDRSCPLGIPVDAATKMTVFRVAVHRRKDPDYRALGFEPLMGLVRSRPQDEVLDPEAYTHWEGLAETMQWFAGCR
ncbi:hypothetical protein Ppa06_63180 [Planomonospora parontospora subsp. parontospora]|uniref:Uncharacterized protein n=2 Tax=Planomonospora parontospora TaxID=58119 RepID=A0AA37BNI1_9ACTN|nr:hypothetical protein [Planomonospora parontospora]GGK94921.1 hypothetical protein GCM10010126_62960 [Planomonospora parontospora]GII12520.1 hypothetical protein Ppa06_63180 [Planomonospora parontospora subsp. parontospora]